MNHPKKTPRLKKLVKTKSNLFTLFAGAMLMVSVILHAQESDPNSSQLQLDDEYAIQSIQSYWAFRGDVPEDGLITIPEGDWIPDFNDPEWAELDFNGYQSWVETNDPDNAELVVETVGYWMEEANHRETYQMNSGVGEALRQLDSETGFGDNGDGIREADPPKEPLVLKKQYSRPGDAADEMGRPVEIYETARLEGLATINFANCEKKDADIKVKFELNSILSSDDPRISSMVETYNIFVYEKLLVLAPKWGQIKIDGKAVEFRHPALPGLKIFKFSPGKGTKLKGSIEYLRPCNSNLTETIWVISNPLRAGPPHNLPKGHRVIDHVWNLSVKHENGLVMEKNLSAIAKTTKDWDLAEMPKGKKYHLLQREGIIYDKLLVRRLRDLSVETPYVAPEKGFDAAGYNTAKLGSRSENWRRPKNDPKQDVQIEKPKK
ncbi:MAG: hypothetical protein VCA36_10465 [Opitutales bacterium]